MEPDETCPSPDDGDCHITSTARTSISKSSSPHRASHGDIVTIDVDLRPEDGFVPEHLFDTSGRITLVLGWGNYLPALHEILTKMTVGETLNNDVSIDAGFGKRHADLLIQIPKANLKKVQNMDRIVVGATLNLQGGVQVQVVQVNQESIVVDANHPLAGSSYACSLKVVNIDPMPVHKMEFRLETDEESSSTPFEIATFAMGCFWGMELAMMRIPGVVGTRAGYTQGTLADPSYQEVCRGNTKHREAVMVVYDSRVVSYQELLMVYGDRLAATESHYAMNIFEEETDDEDRSLQYKNGIYFHTEEQRKLGRAFLEDYNNRYEVELLQANKFYEAEEDHQQYLYKGGQSSRKNARETIRCFG
ncbi:methionine sulfoxide reductase A [Nitzschia inconspicua]|uniref:peptidylprolyl isomerase n=1 Tax=Nitzschia inconspicua TaxID=303405 RepID=A0A9K3KW34_9STRA|nr:methionine sulfoxide reductase A [Nitzschia inconspicua]